MASGAGSGCCTAALAGVATQRPTRSRRSDLRPASRLCHLHLRFHRRPKGVMVEQRGLLSQPLLREAVLTGRFGARFIVLHPFQFDSSWWQVSLETSASGCADCGAGGGASTTRLLSVRRLERLRYRSLLWCLRCWARFWRSSAVASSEVCFRGRGCGRGLSSGWLADQCGSTCRRSRCSMSMGQRKLWSDDVLHCRADDKCMQTVDVPIGRPIANTRDVHSGRARASRCRWGWWGRCTSAERELRAGI